MHLESSSKAWKKTSGTENQRKNRDHLNHSNIKISKNTEKSPGDLSKTCHSDFSERPQANVGAKTHKESNNNNNNNNNNNVRGEFMLSSTL